MSRNARSGQRTGFATGLALLWSEVTLLYLLHLVLTGLFEGQPLLPPVFFFGAALAVLAAAYAASTSDIGSEQTGVHRRRGTAAALVCFVLVEWLADRLAGGRLFATPPGLTPAIVTVLTQIFLLLLLIRAVRLCLHKKSVRIYGHFDFVLLLTFLGLLASSLLPAPLEGGAFWVAAALFFNGASLYLGRRPPGAPIGRVPLALAAGSGLLLLGYEQGADAMPVLSGAASQVLALARPPLALLANAVGSAIAALRGAAPGPTVEPGGAGAGGGPAGAAPIGDFSWMDQAMEAFLWSIAAAAFLAIVLGLLVLLRTLAFQLIAWRTGRTPSAGSFAWPDGRAVLRMVRRTLARCAAYIRAAGDAILLLVPFEPSFHPAASYRRLERWGSRRVRPRRPGETPLQYLEILVASHPAAAQDLSAVTWTFLTSRYGAPDKKQNKAPASVAPRGND